MTHITPRRPRERVFKAASKSANENNKFNISQFYNVYIGVFILFAL